MSDIVKLVLPDSVRFDRGEYIEIEITRVKLGQPVSPIFRSILDPNFRGTQAVIVDSISLNGELIDVDLRNPNSFR